ncbi:MAG TPA: DNA polymerase III subunit gamma and tau [Streptosporangiaceae bacterium]|nr:DNA polymerase III subunit gamma and tau [Streptosporangiaceae bacterium]
MAAAASEREGATRVSGSGLALYRKYRPATFAEVKGQEQVTGPLRQALSTGRINHAYLFSGPRGCGKTSSARILARSLNCVNGPTPDPCGVCDSCVALAPSGPGSIDVIEIDAASHGGVDDARELRERAFYTPVSGRFKIYIIDEAHMVTQQGFNALLKLVEEPPPHLKFIFATTEPEKVIPTIRSRTHHYPFRLVPPSILRELMQDILRAEGVAFEDTVLPLVARAGAGSVRDSLSVLDQLLAGSDESGLSYERAVALLGYTDASLLDEIVDAFAAADGAAVFGVVNRVIEGGHEPRRFAADLLDRFRDLIILAAVPHAAETGLLDLPPDRAERMAAQAGRFGQAELARAAEIVSTALDQMRGATSPRLLLELMCAQVLLPAATTDEKSLLARLERLESGGRGTPAPLPQSPPSPPHSGTNDFSERTRVPAPPDRKAAKPPESAAPAEASPAKATPAEATPAKATPPQAGPAKATPATAPAEPAAPASAPPAAPAGAGPASADSLRQNWGAVLDAVKRERRVAWILLSNASVLSLEEGMLTLGFPRDGDLKGFTTSGCDADLKRVLSTGFGLNVTVKGVVGADPGTGAGPGRPGGLASPGPVAAGGASDPVAAVPARSRPRHDEPPPDDIASDEFAPDDIPPDEPGDQAPVVTELTGMDLIQRELGGQVIGEIDD